MNFTSMPRPQSTDEDKENHRNIATLSYSTKPGISKNSKSRLKERSQMGSPQHSLNYRAKASESVTLTPLSDKISRPLSEHGSGNRIIRYGETVESLFCLTENSLPEHRRLSHEIASGTMMNDAASWRRVLELASEDVAREKQPASRGHDLIRLHRRATSRFSSFTEHQDDRRSAILAIWLSYARAQSVYGSREEARLTFRHIQNKRLGVSNASFYLALAEFERKDDARKAKDVLRLGIDQKAEPQQDLKTALVALEKQLLDEANKDEKKEGGNFGSDRAVKSLIPPLPTQSGLSRSRKRAGDSRISLSPKKSRSEHSTDECSTETKSTIRSSSTGSVNRKDDSASNMSLDMNGMSLSTSDFSLSTDTALHQKGMNAHQTKSTTIPHLQGTGKSPGAITEKRQTVQIKKRNSTESQRAIIPQTSNQLAARRIPTHSCIGKAVSHAVKGLKSQDGNAKPTSTKQPLFSSKKPRLSRLGLGGKAQRVDPQQSCMDDSDDSISDKDKKASEIGHTTDLLDLSVSKPVPKLTKMDLSYMLDWEPKTSKVTEKCTNTPCQVTNIALPMKETKGPAKEKIDEVSSNGSAGSRSVVASSSPLTSLAHSDIKETDSRSNHFEHTEPSAGPRGLTIPQKNLEHGNVPASARRSETASPDVKLNEHFIPLVSENNMLRVNKVPYAKLGVIGKGGSCKVYRALSKECTVLAIKKVKLGGMDRKAIDGYANEISLLKRLRGNPSIIQMYDSEVDISRKAIFVVMELGEVDLNHVLQKQTLESGSKTNSGERPSLNMNFIRLTWQQMLSAVHSIHEERIIHGDLKPANFLFVRGALKLIDFGIAKAIQSDDTTNIYRDSQIGTLNYMSPEAILDTGSGENGARMKCGRASDIWSLGCILYQMVYGRTPFAELHMIQKLQAIVNPNHKISFPDTVDEAALDAMKLCLRRDPDSRPPIVGRNGLLNEHWFLHSQRRSNNR